MEKTEIKTKRLQKARETILSLNVRDFMNEELLEALNQLEISLGDIRKISKYSQRAFKF